MCVCVCVFCVQSQRLNHAVYCKHSKVLQYNYIIIIIVLLQSVVSNRVTFFYCVLVCLTLVMEFCMSGIFALGLV